jgi:hypothetical protein
VVQSVSFSTRRQMKDSDKLQASAGLVLGENPYVSIGYEAGLFR